MVTFNGTKLEQHEQHIAQLRVYRKHCVREIAHVEAELLLCKRGISDIDAEIAKELAAVQALADEELAGDYVVVHGTLGPHKQGSRVTLSAVDARLALAQGIVEPAAMVVEAPADEEPAAVDGDAGGTEPIEPIVVTSPLAQAIIESHGSDVTTPPAQVADGNVEPMTESTMGEVQGDCSGTAPPTVDQSATDAAPKP